METIFVKDNINKISESLSSQKIDLNNTAYVDFSFSPKTIKKIVRITKSSVIGEASVHGLTKTTTSLWGIHHDGIYFYCDSIEMLSPYSGYAILSFQGRRSTSVDKLLKIELGKVFLNLEDCFSYILPLAKLKVDPFTNSKSLSWGKEFIYHINDTSLNIAFEFKENTACICFSTMKDIKIQLGDTISFLFESGRIIDFPIQKRPIKETTEQKEEWFCVFCDIYKEDIDLFINERCCKFRITYCKSNKAPLTGKFVDNEYSPYDHELFAAYSKRYLDELARLVPDFELPHRNIKSNLVGYTFNWCYVYLMRDTTNGYHKIGISNKPEYREKTLQSEKPSIEMLACKKFPTRKIAEAIEAALHNAYSLQRVRGEWFNLNDEDVAAIIETLK